MSAALAVVQDPDPFERIEAARVEAKRSLDAAEQEMVALAFGDTPEFAEAKARRDAARLALEQLDYQEKAERQRLEQAGRDAKAAELQKRQDAAHEAHERGRALAEDVKRIVAGLAEAVRGMRECQEAVDKGVHYESFAVRDKEIPRPTIQPKLSLDPDHAVLALRAAREYVRLAGMSEQVADIRATQGKL